MCVYVCLSVCVCVCLCVCVCKDIYRYRKYQKICIYRDVQCGELEERKKKKFVDEIPVFQDCEIPINGASNILGSHARKCQCSSMEGSPFEDVVWHVQATTTTSVTVNQNVWVVDCEVEENQCVVKVSQGRVKIGRSVLKKKVSGADITFKSPDGSKSSYWYAYSEMHTTFESAQEGIVKAQAAIVNTKNQEYIKHCLIKL